MAYKTFAIVGATGLQGGAIVRHIAKEYPAATIRAITRSPEKPNALELKELGPHVEIVQGDLADKASLVSAFQGADVVYLVTDYWNSQSSLDTPNMNTEIMNGIVAIEAAAETKSLKHFIFGTLPHVATQSVDMQWKNIYHFNTKIALNSYIMAKSDLWNKTTFVFTPIYFENFLAVEQPFYPVLGGPQIVESENGVAYISTYPQDGTKNQPFFSVNDLGKVVAEICAHPDKYFKKLVLAVSEVLDAQDLISIWGETVGVKSSVRTVSFEKYVDIALKLGTPRFMAVEIYEQMKGLHEVDPEAVTIHGIEKVDIGKVVKLTGWKEWVQQQDWKPYFAHQEKLRLNE